MMIKPIVWMETPEHQRKSILRRPSYKRETLVSQVKQIIRVVKNRGDDALFELSHLYDQFEESQFKLPSMLVSTTIDKLDSKLKSAIDDAYERIRLFHSSAIPSNQQVKTAHGVSCEYDYHPFESVGLYVPGGTAPLISTVLMTGIPAQLAGVDNIVLCTPLTQYDDIHPGVAYAAKKCDINNIYALGGAQAVAAMAYGTESIPRVQKIFGPGNSWVTEAKQQVAFDPEGAAIDMPAGPSEVMIIADNSADSDFIALDLLSQLEHGPDSQAILLCTDSKLIDEVIEKLPKFIKNLNREEILDQSIKNVRTIEVNTIDLAIKIANQYAPEHLLMQVDNPRSYVSQIRNCGSLFLGHYTPESLGDYCSGTNHVLPTYGFARSYNGLSVMDYMQRMTIQEASSEGVMAIGSCAMILAEAEGLEAHKQAVNVRIKKLKS